MNKEEYIKQTEELNKRIEQLKDEQSKLSNEYIRDNSIYPIGTKLLGDVNCHKAICYLSEVSCNKDGKLFYIVEVEGWIDRKHNSYDVIWYVNEEDLKEFQVIKN